MNKNNCKHNKESMEIANQLLQTNDFQIINLQSSKCLPQRSIQVNNRKYILQLIKNLHNNSPYKSNHNIFYLALLYFEIISSNPKTKATINNQDIIALCCFYIAIKSSIVQFEMITISQLKGILSKFKAYNNNFILLSEIKCISLLDYRINYMTCYDYLLYYYRDNKSLLTQANEELEKIIFKDNYIYITKTQYQIANQVMKAIRERTKENIIPMNNVNCSNELYQKRERCFIKMNTKPMLSIFNESSKENSKMCRNKVNEESFSKNPNRSCYNIFTTNNNMNRVIGNRTKTSSIDLSSIQQSKLNIDFKNLSNLSSKINTKVLKTFSQINVNIFKKKLS